MLGTSVPNRADPFLLGAAEATKMYGRNIGKSSKKRLHVRTAPCCNINPSYNSWQSPIVHTAAADKWVTGTMSLRAAHKCFVLSLWIGVGCNSGPLGNLHGVPIPIKSTQSSPIPIEISINIY